VSQSIAQRINQLESTLTELMIVVAIIDILSTIATPACTICVNRVKAARGPKIISNTSYCQGFTAVEMMVTVAIMGILTAVAIPSYSAMMAKYRLSNENTSLMLDFVLARGEAISRSTRVSVCQSSDGATCTADGWASGRIVFVDATTAGSVEAGDVILRVSSATASGDLMTTPNGASFVSYNSAGVSNTNLTITTCKTGYSGAKVIIYPTGRIRKDSSGLCA